MGGRKRIIQKEKERRNITRNKKKKYNEKERETKEDRQCKWNIYK